MTIPQTEVVLHPTTRKPAAAGFRRRARAPIVNIGMTRFRRRHEVDGEWWAQDRAGHWHRWDDDAADWVPDAAGPPPDKLGRARPSVGGHGFSWGLRRAPRPGRRAGFEASFSLGDAPPGERPEDPYSGVFQTTVRRRDSFGNVVRRDRRIPLRRKRPSSLRQGARFFGLVTLVLADVALIQQQWPALVVCLTIAGALLAYWYAAPDRGRYSPDWPYDSQEPPWEDRPGAEALAGWIPRPTRAAIALVLTGAVLGSWMLIEQTAEQVLIALVPAGAVAILGYEIPIRPVPWVVRMSCVFGGIVTFAVAGIVLVFPSGGASGVSAVAFAAAGFITSAAVTYTVLQLGVVAHRVGM
jgi:hypothetical protein